MRFYFALHSDLPITDYQRHILSDIQRGYVNKPNGQPATLSTAYIDAIAANITGLVTQVSFYAAQSCNDKNIYFGAFSVLTPISSSSNVFSLTADSHPLLIDRTSESDTTMKLVTISLCVTSSPQSDCQGKAFTINNDQYFGSYSTQCIMGYAPTSASVYPSTYFQQSSNPFANGDQATATYTNSYANVVLQYITIQPSSTADLLIFLCLTHI